MCDATDRAAVPTTLAYYDWCDYCVSRQGSHPLEDAADGAGVVRTHVAPIGQSSVVMSLEETLTAAGTSSAAPVVCVLDEVLSPAAARKLAAELIDAANRLDDAR